MDFRELPVLKIQLIDNFERLETYQNKLSEFLLHNEKVKKLFAEYFEYAEDYKDKYIEVYSRIDKTT